MTRESSDYSASREAQAGRWTAVGEPEACSPFEWVPRRHLAAVKNPLEYQPRAGILAVPCLVAGSPGWLVARRPHWPSRGWSSVAWSSIESVVFGWRNLVGEADSHRPGGCRRAEPNWPREVSASTPNRVGRSAWRPGPPRDSPSSQANHSPTAIAPRQSSTQSTRRRMPRHLTQWVVFARFPPPATVQTVPATPNRGTRPHGWCG